MPNEQEIEAILDGFEEWMAIRIAARPGQKVGCVICRHPNRREINRLTLERKLNDHKLALKFGFHPCSTVHHRLNCLPKCMNLPPPFRLPHMKKNFPRYGKPLAQKIWYLDELLFLRKEVLKKDPLDPKELLRLAIEIDKAADALKEAREKAKEQKRIKQGRGIEDLTPEQIAEIAKVGNGGTGVTS
jgi:hypothetical protein